MKRLKIVLADVPMAELQFNFYQPTMGILYLLGALKKYCSESMYEVTYLQGNKDLKSHLEIIEKIKPDIYGISFKTPMAKLAYQCMDEVKRKLPNCKVICGGSHPSVKYEEILSVSKADLVFRGECEITFTDFVSRVYNGKEYFDIPGLGYLKGSNIINNPLLPFEKNIDNFPQPDWESINPLDYPGMPYRKGFPYLGVVVSRGCPFSCSFCSEPIWKIFGKPSFRERTIPSIIGEIDLLVSKGVKEIRLWCEEFNTNIKWSKELLAAIVARNYKDVYFNFNLRGDAMDDEMADLMAAANVWMVSVGIESASNRVLLGVQKKVTIEQIEHACKLLSSRGIKIQGYFQFFNVWETNSSLQFESFREVLSTLRWALKKSLKGELHYMFTSFSTPVPDTPLWQIATKYNLFRNDQSLPLAYLHSEMNIPGITAFNLLCVRMSSLFVKSFVALKSGNINPKLVVHILKRSFKRISSNKYEDGY